MKIAYFTSHVYEPDFVSAPLKGQRPNPAGENFHEKVIKALARFAEVQVYSYVPLTLDLPEKDFISPEGISYHYVKTSENKFARALFGPGKLAKRAKKSHYDFVFFDSLNRAAAIAALKTASNSACPSIAILTDHPTNITGLSNSYCNALLELGGKASACFALTSHLAEAFGYLDKPHFVQPVLVDVESVEAYAHPNPYIYYGGALFVKDGLPDLINAVCATNAKYDLIIAGHGPYETEIAKVAEKNPHIIFKGQVSKKEHLSLIAGSAISINPRRYVKSIDDYAVPSKVMEYLCYAPCLASTISTPLKELFRSDINWIYDGTLNFFKEFIGNDGTFVGIKKNTAKDRMESLFGINKTSEDLQRFLANLAPLGSRK